MDIIKFILDKIDKAIDSGNISIIIYGFCILIITWFYRHFKTYTYEQDKENLKRLDLALEAYGNIYAQISSIKEDDHNLENLRFTIYKYCNYLPKDVLEQILELNLTKNKSIEQLNNIIKKEILYLKSLQLDPVTYRINDNFYKNIEYYINKSKFNLVFTPFVYSILAFIGIFLSVSVIFTFITTNTFNKISIFIALIYLVLVLLILPAILQIVFNKDSGLNCKTVVPVLLLILLPLICTVYIYKYLIFIAFICLIIYIVFYLIPAIKKHHPYKQNNKK